MRHLPDLTNVEYALLLRTLTQHTDPSGYNQARILITKIQDNTTYFQKGDKPCDCDMSCPKCGTTEMLCGHNGVGCTSGN